jgi:hypothetical protein
LLDWEESDKSGVIAGETVRGIIAANLSKAGWRWAEFQQLIPTGKQSGLPTHIAATESVSLCMRMKS